MNDRMLYILQRKNQKGRGREEEMSFIKKFGGGGDDGGKVSNRAGRLGNWGGGKDMYIYIYISCIYYAVLSIYSERES
jgi:hypothetical protein